MSDDAQAQRRRVRTKSPCKINAAATLPIDTAVSDCSAHMDRPLSHHIAEVKQKIILYREALEIEEDVLIKAQWDFALRNIQLALAHYELAYKIETETKVPGLDAYHHDKAS
ncbi:MAG: hypothetical protein NVS9B15_11540 [Acidobacteriaceae bacterium]